MNLTYSVRDAERWAAFSGDYNPIHFDLQRARALGGDDLSVHGMRALLDMKQFLAAALDQTAPQGKVYLFSARLRQPVICHKAYRIALSGPMDSVRLGAKMVDDADGAVCFSAKIAAAKPLEAGSRIRAKYYSVDELQALSLCFPVAAGAPGRLWSFLDAVLFQRIVEAQETLQMVKEAFPTMAASTLGEVFEQVPVVQTHHDVQFDACLLDPGGVVLLEKGLCCAIQPPLVMGSQESGFVLSISVQAWIDERPLISTSVALKTLPMP